MSYTLKNIKVICIIICYFCILNSNLLATDYFRYIVLLANKKYVTNTAEVLQQCRASKNNNFQDRSPEERIVLSYLNAILDKILSDNEDILEKFGRSKYQFCIDTKTLKNSSFASGGLGFITVDLDKEYEFLQNGLHAYESYIVATISHEIAHDLLKHILKDMNKRLEIYDTSSFKNNYSEINEYNFDEQFLTMDENELDRSITILRSKTNDFEKQKAEYKRFLSNTGELEKEHIEWSQFYKNHPEYIKSQQSSEIEADNLGLQLYLNTGFRPEDFGKHYISNRYNYNGNIYYHYIPDMFVSLSQNDNYIKEGNEAKITGNFDKFMHSIKFVNPSLNTHPSDFWRYWNARVQIEAANINLHRGIQNGLYFKIDLSKLKKLKEFKTFFSNSNNVNSSITDENDPRVYIINKLLTSKSRPLDYTIEFFPHNRKDTGVILKDNTLLLRAYDIYIILLIKRNISIIKDHVPLLNQKTFQYPTNDCMDLFTLSPDTVINALYDMFHVSIKKAFLSK